MENDNVQMEFIVNGAAMGEAAGRFLAMGCNSLSLRPYVGEDGRPYVSGINAKGELEAFAANAATLRKEEWLQIDDVVQTVKQQRIGGIQDLESNGLVYNISNPMGTTSLEFELESDIGGAEMNMDAVTRARKDRPEYTTGSLPLPIVFKDFSYTTRVLAASRQKGQPLNTRSVFLATTKLYQHLDQMLFKGASAYSFAGGTIRGYEDAPSKNTVTLTKNWDDSAKTGAEILADVKEMKQASIDAKHFGPWVIYVPTAYETVLDGDHTAGYPKTIRSRILEIDGIQSVKVSDSMTANKVIMVQMTQDVIQLVKGMGVTPVQWNTEGNMIHNFKVWTIQVPWVKADAEGNCGITVLA